MEIKCECQIKFNSYFSMHYAIIVVVDFNVSNILHF